MKPTLSSISIAVLFLLFARPTLAQQQGSSDNVFLLSNLESLSATAPELDAIQNVLEQEINPFTLLINGDFVDENGLGENPSQADLDKINRLIQLTENKGRIIFLPGDREWDESGSKGLKKVKALEKYLESKLGKGEVLFPQKGCPGPEIIDVGEHLRIIAVNSQWFNQKNERANEEDADCKILNEKEFWEELNDVLDEASNRNLIIAEHHPVLSYGQYAGYKLTAQHFKPPIVGSIIASYHQNVGGPKDLNNKNLKHYAREMSKLAERHPGAIFVSGHEYDIQLLYKEGNYHINSGAFAKARPVAKGKETIYKSKRTGFAKLIFEDKGAVYFKSFDLKQNAIIEEKFTHQLFTSPCDKITNDIPVNIQFNPCQKEIESAVHSNPDQPLFGSATPGTQYAAGFLKRLILGKHYRSTWATEVQNIPCLDLDTMHGGLTPYARGGGAQTVSLKFKTKDGRRYAFRSINKNAIQRMDKDLTAGIYGKLSQDFTSHQHPYGSLMVGVLMDEMGLPHSKPKLFLMPDSPKLGPFQEEFAGKFGTLELKPKGKKKSREGFREADKVVSTFQMYRKLLDDNDNQLDVQNYVQARILDILLSDRDRHIKNWKWLAYKEGDGYTYKPFPKDRDKAFSVLNGVYWMFNLLSVYPDRVSFNKNYTSLKKLNYKNKSMDRWLCTRFGREDWKREALWVQSLITDEVIEKAVSAMPPEVQPLTKDKLIEILKVRRNKLPKAIDKYYDLLAKYVDLVGSNSRDLFELNRLSNGDVEVKLFNLKKKGGKGKLIFERTFKREETKEIRLHGLGKKDRFVITGESQKSIFIRIIGGDGKDEVLENSKVGGFKRMTKVYDNRGKDKLELNKEGKKQKADEVLTFESENIFNYNFIQFLPAFSFNQDDGFGLGLTANIIRQRFNRPDFSKKFNVSASLTTKRNYRLNINSQFRHVVQKWDLLVNAHIASRERAFRRFFGFSNETIIDNDLDDFGFYNNETRSYGGAIGLTRSFWNRSSFIFSGVFDHRNVKPAPRGGLEESVYDQLPRNNGLGETTLLGPRAELNIDLRDHATFPTKGMQIQLRNFTFFNSERDWKLGGRLDAEVSAFFTRGIKLPVTLSLKSGFVSAYKETPFYYKAYLGQQNNHRGFRRNRFGGDSVAYLNSDLRFHFGKVITPLIPIKYGIFGLYDIGRAWADGEDSDTWHYAYGGGVYLVPYLESFNLTFTLARSDEKRTLFSFGVGFFVR